MADDRRRGFGYDLGVGVLGNLVAAAIVAVVLQLTGAVEVDPELLALAIAAVVTAAVVGPLAWIARKASSPDLANAIYVYAIPVVVAAFVLFCSWVLVWGA